MTEREALKLALEALEDLGMKHYESTGEVLYKDTFTAIKEALAQPEQEPDWKGLVLSHNEDCESRCDMDRCGYKPYYEYNGRRCPDCPIHEKIWVEYTPPQRTWVGLTDEDKNEILVDAVKHGWSDRLIVEQIEAKLKEKNT